MTVDVYKRRGYSGWHLVRRDRISDNTYYITSDRGLRESKRSGVEVVTSPMFHLVAKNFKVKYK